MPVFISKLQYKNYEKGEYSDEEARGLEETLQLIDNFPWDEQRHLTDIQLTGPSVTIENFAGEYLKIGLYFNRKFAVYYLNANGGFYEGHCNTLIEVKEIVASFFKHKITTDKFEKSLFSSGHKRHFITRTFEYSIKLWRVIAVNVFMIVYTIMFIVACSVPYLQKGPELIILFMFLGALLLCLYMLVIINNVYKNINNYLRISKGNDVFSFGYNHSEIYSFNKKDISRITIYEAKGTRNPIMVKVIDIDFNDGASIRFNNMLISSTTFFGKFSDHDFPPCTSGKGLFKVL